MADEPKKIFDLKDTETEPTDEQLAELMHLVGNAIRAESAEINARISREAARIKPEACVEGSVEIRRAEVSRS